MGWYMVAKDFAGPAATVIASITAGCITFVLGRRQVRIAASQAETAAAQRDIAKSQRDLAFDKLKFDLFEKRYAIYAAARELIERIGQRPNDGPYDQRIRELRLILQESAFFFPEPERKLFDTIESATKEYLIGEVERNSAGEDDKERIAAANKMTEALKVLVRIYEQLPSLMERELGFEQLTGARAGVKDGIRPQKGA